MDKLKIVQALSGENIIKDLEYKKDEDKLYVSNKAVNDFYILLVIAAVKRKTLEKPTEDEVIDALKSICVGDIDFCPDFSNEKLLSKQLVMFKSTVKVYYLNDYDEVPQFEIDYALRSGLSQEQVDTIINQVYNDDNELNT